MITYYTAVNNFNRVAEYANFNENKYYRIPKGYYKNTNRPYSFLHHDVWVYHGNQLIQGLDIHHKDHDKKNNEIENLEQITKSNHTKHHLSSVSPKVFICKMCGTEFESVSYHNNVLFCKSCYIIHEKQRKSQWAKDNRIRLSAKSLANYHSEKYNEIRECEHCKSEFSVIKSSPQRFCSRSCTAKATNHTKQSDKYNSKKSIFKCPVCGKDYKTYTTGVNHKKTCSKECSYKQRFLNRN